jgi:hypothetical protein
MVRRATKAEASPQSPNIALEAQAEAQVTTKKPRTARSLQTRLQQLYNYAYILPGTINRKTTTTKMAELFIDPALQAPEIDPALTNGLAQQQPADVEMADSAPPQAVSPHSPNLPPTHH